MSEEKTRAYVAMSGGVDSAVSACLMADAGYDVTGVTYSLCAECSEEACCNTDEAIRDASNVCAALGIKHVTEDLGFAFKRYVIDSFIAAYESAMTPNPCVECNRYIKFSRIPEGGVLATGHYARVEHDAETGRYYVRMAKDAARDQSYMLYGLGQDVLARVRFPLGELTKDEVRAYAAARGLACAERKDSQDICFVPDGDYADFVEEYTRKKYPVGEFTDTDGRILGTHKGLIRYTIGQRRGLGLALPESLYVGRLDREHNRVVLCRDNELWRSELLAEDVCYMKYASLDAPLRVTAKIRYAHKPQPATAVVEDGVLKVTFDEPQRAITPGQAVVLYEGDAVVAGAKITGTT